MIAPSPFLKVFLTRPLIWIAGLLAIVVLFHVYLTLRKENNTTQFLLPTIKPSIMYGEAANQQECRQIGGVWQKWGLLGEEYCQIPSADADKSCTDGSQCSLGKCISETNQIPGICQKFKNTFGCISFIEDGKIESAVCID